MVMAASYDIEIVRVGNFERHVGRVLSDESVIGLMTFLARNPEAGDIIPGTSGIRKLRWGMEGRGKRRGARVIYYYRDLNMPLYLLDVYGKSEKIDLTAKEKKELRRLVDELVLHHGSMTWANVFKMHVGEGA